jgi:hypothetical protein
MEENTALYNDFVTTNTTVRLCKTSLSVPCPLLIQKYVNKE